ncbi:MAG: transposase [Methylococcales bacterium]|nr:transposase [Methylococcales bacterium]
MARQLRIELSGGLYHVTSRGNRQEAIYFEDADCLAWLALLGNVCRRFNWICHAYCQMTNHYHLVLETPEANLSRGMRQLNGVYTQYVNRTYSRVGHVFQGRYKAILVEKDSYLLALARYVVLNPVRAGMVSHPADWPWSSFPGMIDQEKAPAWLQTDWLLAQFGRDRQAAMRSYVDFVLAGQGLPGIWEGLRRQIYLGNDAFIESMQKQIMIDKQLIEIPRVQHHPPAKLLDYYATKYPQRNEAMTMAFKTGDYSLKAIADHFDVHYSTVSRVVNKFKKELE